MARTESRPKPSRVLAPAGNFPGRRELKQARSLISQAAGELKASGDPAGGSSYSITVRACEQLIAQALGVERVICFGSGAESLAALAAQLKERYGCTHAVVAAYTCPEVAAAIVRAGLRLRLADVRQDTLDMLLLSHTERTELVVLSNLFGLPDRVDLWRDENRIVIDDACQALLSAAEDISVGARSQFGIASFGRGKALCGIGGGAVLIPSEDDSAHSLVDAAAIRGVARELLRARKISGSLPRALRDRAFLSAVRLLEQPQFYGRIARLPGLQLGSTRCDLSFSDTTLTEPMLAAAVAQLCRAQDITRRALANARRWHERLADLELTEPFIERGLTFDGNVIPVRYPIVLSTAERRDALLAAMAAEGLGASGSYDRALPEFPELSAYIDEGDGAGAADVARRIVTLPVHEYVSEEDIERGRAVVRRVLSET